MYRVPMMTPKVKNRSSVLERAKPTKWSTWKKADALFGFASAVLPEQETLTTGGSEPPS